MNRKFGIVAAVAALVFALPAAANAAKGGFVDESIQVADHFMIQPNQQPATIAPGATILVRDHKADVVTATVKSAALTPGHVYSIWWVVFNRPWKCTIPYECGSGDLSNSAVRGSVFWGGGILADGDGYGTTQLELRPGRTKRELFGPMTEIGLRNLRGAEIHVVLRTHGPAGEAGTVAQQLGTANDACPAEGCANAFFSLHRTK